MAVPHTGDLRSLGPVRRPPSSSCTHSARHAPYPSSSRTASGSSTSSSGSSESSTFTDFTGATSDMEPAVAVEKPRPLPGRRVVTAPATPRAPAQVVLPRNLARPAFTPIPEGALGNVNEDLKDVPVQYVHERLKKLGPKIMYNLAHTTASAPDSSLPRALSVTVAPEPSSDGDDAVEELNTLPTHLLAVYARSAPGEARRKVTLFPTHALVLAAYCANLPPLPKLDEADEEMEDENAPALSEAISLRIPVVPLCVPAPNSFPLLQAYLYTKRIDALLAALLPSLSLSALSPSKRADEEPPLTPPATPSLSSLTQQLVETHSRMELMNAAVLTHGVWSNAVTLGVFDDGLWRAIEWAWGVLLSALEAQ